MVRVGVISVVFVLTLGVAACGGGGGTQPATGAVTFWQDVAPIYNSKCVRCHQEGGIAPFRLDNYADAQAHAALEKQRTAAGTMPPYFMVHDGSCQSFQDDVSLTANQKSTIAAWVDGGAPEGTPVDADAAAAAGAGGRGRHRDAAVHAGGAGRAARGVRRVPLLPARFAGGLERLPHRLRRHARRRVDRPSRAGVHRRSAGDGPGRAHQRRDHAGARRRLTRSPGLALLRRRRRRRGRVGLPVDLGARPGDRRVPDRHGRADQDDRQAGHPDPLQPRGPRLRRQDRQHHRPPAVREQRQPPARVPAARTACSTRSATRRPTRCRPGRPTSRTTWTRTGRDMGLRRQSRPSIWWASCRTCTGAASGRR